MLKDRHPALFHAILFLKSTLRNTHMLANDRIIANWAASGGIQPYDPALVNPASIDLRLGGEFINLETQLRLRTDEITIKPGQAILATTLEYIVMPSLYAGAVYLKSSMARLGLDHALAGWVDPGFHGELTLEFHSHRPVTLRKGQKVCQLVLYRLEAKPDRDYQITGRYNGQRGPTEAK
jgi:dCTP deaminase